MGTKEPIIKEVTTRIFPASPSSIQVLNKGATNEVFEVKFPESTIVVRISPEVNADQFKKEQWGMEEASKLQIPSPKVLAVGMQNDSPYMVLEYIDGVHGSESPDATNIWRELGKYAKAIHSIPIEGFGDHMLTPGKFVSNRNGFEEYVQYNIDCLSVDDKLLQIGILTQAQSEQIKKLFESLKGQDFQFGLNHGDLALRNTITSRTGEVFLLDWGSSEVHIIPHFDIVEVLQTSFNFDSENQDFTVFLDGCGIGKEQFLAIKPVIDKLFLLRAIDKLRWALEKNPSKLDRFKNNIDKVLNYLQL